MSASHHGFSRRRGLASVTVSFLALAGATHLHAQSSKEDVGRFYGTVRSAELRPVTSATVTLPDVGRMAITNGQGEFYMRDLPPGQHLVEVAYLGLEFQTSIDVSAGNLALKHYKLDLALDELEPLRVEASRAASMKMRQFVKRAARAAGYFFGRDDIDRIAPIATPDLLQGLAGVRNEDGRGQRYEIGRGVGNCRPNLFIDGSPVVVFGPEDFLPQHIEAVEVYKSFSTTPTRYRSGNRCGAIVIWSRETFQ